jgi:hypothetical protein
MDAEPTVTLATLQVEYSDGSAIIVVVPEARLCEMTTPLASAREAGEHWTDAAHYDAPGGRAERIMPPDPHDLRIRLGNVSAWRLAIRRAGQAWSDETRGWLANGSPR